MLRQLASVSLMLTAVLWTAGAWARDESHSNSAIAIVIELSGKAESQLDGRHIAVSTLSEFDPGSRLRLHNDAKVLLLFYGSGERFAVNGPSLIRFSRAGLEAMSGNDPVRKPALQGKDGRNLAVRASGVAQAGIVVRGSNKPISALNPIGAVTLEPRPIFRWREIEPGLEYRFILRDADGQVLLDRTTRGGSLELPAQIKFTEGRRYSWSLSTRAPDGTNYASNRKLSMADSAMRSEIENFRPDTNAIASDRILFALWLERAGLADEAARYWRELAGAGISLPPDRLEPGQ